jgi:hypothetical protein
MSNAKRQGFLDYRKLKTDDKPHLSNRKVKFLIWILTLKIWILFGIWFLKFRFKLI